MMYDVWFRNGHYYSKRVNVTPLPEAEAKALAVRLNMFKKNSNYLYIAKPIKSKASHTIVFDWRLY